MKPLTQLEEQWTERYEFVTQYCRIELRSKLTQKKQAELIAYINLNRLQQECDAKQLCIQKQDCMFLECFGKCDLIHDLSPGDIILSPVKDELGNTFLSYGMITTELDDIVLPLHSMTNEALYYYPPIKGIVPFFKQWLTNESGELEPGKCVEIVRTSQSRLIAPLQCASIWCQKYYKRNMYLDCCRMMNKLYVLDGINLLDLLLHGRLATWFVPTFCKNRWRTYFSYVKVTFCELGIYLYEPRWEFDLFYLLARSTSPYPWTKEEWTWAYRVYEYLRDKKRPGADEFS